MDLADLNDNDQKFLEKMRKTFGNFVDSVDGLPVSELEKNLTIYTKHREDTEMAQRVDKALNDAKELVSELSAPYKQVIGALKMKLRFIHLLMKFKNGELIQEATDNE